MTNEQATWLRDCLGLLRERISIVSEQSDLVLEAILGVHRPVDQNRLEALKLAHGDGQRSAAQIIEQAKAYADFLIGTEPPASEEGADAQ